MVKFFGILFSLILVDFYYFPFEFKFLPVANVKLMMAVVGLAIAAFSLIKKRDHTFPRPVLVMFLLSSLVSCFCLLSVVYNSTTDTSYVSYVFSCMVWLSGAFTTCYFIKLIHGDISVKSITYYLVAVSAIQSVLAYAISVYPAIGDFICAYTSGMHTFAKTAGRMYSLGVGVDVAGSRFATALAALGPLMCVERNRMSAKEIWLCWLGFAIILVFGNMVARTTVVGAGIMLCCIGLYACLHFREMRRIIRPAIVATLLFVPVIVWKYNAGGPFRGHIDYAFEGFFSLFETGRWHTTSNDNLVEMVKIPQDVKTWLIGDGYFLNALQYDINYLGPEYTGGYYMGTDIGYLRFLYYFGLPGLLSMIAVVTYPTVVCCKKMKEYEIVFLAVLLCGLAIWCKVATDVWYMLALYFCAVYMQEEQKDIEK